MNNLINSYSGSEAEPCRCSGSQNKTAQLMMPLSILNKNCEFKMIWKSLGIFVLLVGFYLMIGLTSVGGPLFNSGMSGKSPNNKDILPVLSVTVPREENPDTYNIEDEIKANGHYIQLCAERYATDDPNSTYPRSIEVLNQQGYGATYTNPVTRKPGKVVAYGTFSAGDFSYLVSNTPYIEAYIVVVYGVEKPSTFTLSNNTSKPEPVIIGYGSEGVILTLASMYISLSNTIKFTDSISNQIYTVTRDKDGFMTVSK